MKSEERRAERTAARGKKEIKSEKEEIHLIIETIDKTVESYKDTLVNLSHEIHDDPEIGRQEFHAVARAKKILTEAGFTFDNPFAGMDTAFKAVYKGQPGGKVVAFLAEYDALAGLGHGCGHNLIITMAIGAALGLKSMLKDIPGEVWVLGTPAEETEGGKVEMVEKHVFDDVDYALMIHPSDVNMIQRGGLACCDVTVEYHGKPAHSSRPSLGINALDALISLFNGINLRRPYWPDKSRCNGIITAGGTASNVICDLAIGKFTVRAEKAGQMRPMLADMENIAKAAAAMTGAKLVWKPGLLTTERYPNKAMDETLKSHAADYGVDMQYPAPDEQVGSSDFGNVSMVVPGIHAYLSIAPEGGHIGGHTPEMVAAACSPIADKTAIIGAKCLAMTGYDILTKPDLQEEIAKEFAKVPKLG